MQRRLIDTNLIVRHVVGDNERQAKTAARLFGASDRGEISLVLLPTVLAECVFVLESFYKHSRTDISQVLTELLTSPGVEIEEEEIHLDALRRYAQTKLHFVDCTLAATAAARKLPLATFDRAISRFSDVTTDLK